MFKFLHRITLLLFLMVSYCVNNGKLILFTAFMAISSNLCFAQTTGNHLKVLNSQNEKWWGGITADGHLMPFNTDYSHQFIGNNKGNQIQPLLLSSEGQIIWSEEPFNFTYSSDAIIIDSSIAEVVHKKVGNTLKEAYQYANQSFFPPVGKLPDETLFTKPQYNTWIELMYDQNQKDILKYARTIIDHGFPPGVLMIDDNWQEDYGKWTWHPARFPDPKFMMEQLHQMGFKVMLWVCPFVSPDSEVYRSLLPKRAFLVASGNSADRNKRLKDFRGNPKPEMVSWWNGISAVLDLSNPEATQWFRDQLDRLQKEYGVDGFKFDAGDTRFYKNGASYGKISANQQTLLFGKIGLDYPLNEYRAMWKMGGQPLVERLKDKQHNWKDLQKLIPQMGLMGLMGYPFSCPDMIGGGEFKSFLGDAIIDQELIVRSAQCHALMPMMQFSVAPWRILKQENLDAVKKAVKLRSRFSDYILKTAKESARTGEPVLSLMEYLYPNMGYEKIKDQFLLGEWLLVAPVLTKNTNERKVHIPPGSWKSYKGKIIKGPTQLKLSIAIDDLPYFEKIK